MVPTTDFAGPLATATYPRRGIMEMARQFDRSFSPYTTMASYPMSVAPPFQSPSYANFPPPHFPPVGPSFPQFSPYLGGAMPFGFHPGMPPMPNTFAAPYRNSATRSWPQPPWPNPPYGMSFGPRPMPMQSFPKSPCELNPAMCQQNFPICPCGCGRPVLVSIIC